MNVLNVSSSKVPRSCPTILPRTASCAGRAAFWQRKQDGVATRLVYRTVDADDADCQGNEPVMAGEQVVGVTTSGAYGHTVGTSIAFAYVEPAFAATGTELEIPILGANRAARVVDAPLYVPDNERLRA